VPRAPALRVAAGAEATRETRTEGLGVQRATESHCQVGPDPVAPTEQLKRSFTRTFETASGLTKPTRPSGRAQSPGEKERSRKTEASFRSDNSGEKYCIRIHVVFRLYLVKNI
jgi:hypothetical protein